MTLLPDDASDEQDAKKIILAGVEDAKIFIQNLEIEDIRNGDWFSTLLTKVISAYQRNATAEYFQQKYPGLPADDIADKLISVTVRNAAILGALSGVASSTSQIATFMTAGMASTAFLLSIGTEMVCLSALQMRLILDLATIYDLQLDPDDPEDMLVIFGYGLGVAPTELTGKAMHLMAGAGTKKALSIKVA